MKFAMCTFELLIDHRMGRLSSSGHEIVHRKVTRMWGGWWWGGCSLIIYEIGLFHSNWGRLGWMLVRRCGGGVGGVRVGCGSVVGGAGGIMVLEVR